MSHDQINPYRPPESAPAAAPRELKFDWTGKAGAAQALVLIACIAYLSFIYMLVTSIGQDRLAGYLFCGNIPVLLVWVVAMVARDRRSHWGGVAAALVQVVIFFAMIALEIGDFVLVLSINAGIAAGFLVLAILLSRACSVSTSASTKKG